jgi:hypothetical protein
VRLAPAIAAARQRPRTAFWTASTVSGVGIRREIRDDEITGRVGHDWAIFVPRVPLINTDGCA